MGRGVINQVWVGGSSTNYGGGTIRQQWGIGVYIFPPVCTGTQNPQNYFSNTYVLPSVNRTAGPIKSRHWRLYTRNTAGVWSINRDQNVDRLTVPHPHPSLVAYSHYTGMGPGAVLALAQLETLGPGPYPWLRPVWTFLHILTFHLVPIMVLFPWNVNSLQCSVTWIC